jgi:hypothetical protein
MKLNQNSLIFILDRKEYAKSYQENMKREGKERGFNGHVHERTIELMEEQGYRKLVFSNKSRREIENYIIPKEIRFDVLNSLPNRTDLIQLDESWVLKYKKTDTKIFVVYSFAMPIQDGYIDINHKYIEFDLLTGETYPKLENEVEEKYHYKNHESLVISHKGSEFVLPLWEKFMKVICYLELTPVTLLVVNGGESKGNVLRDNFIKNETKTSVIQVTSNWNYRMIRVGSFKVNGHFRWQPCGKGYSQIKLIYINQFEKGLMKRLAKKELQN